MAVRRSQNWLNQQRADVPHLRSIESAVRNDFDELLSGMVTGAGKSYILNGFEINMTGAINSSASGLQVIVAESSLLHGNSNESGTFFLIPSLTPNETLSSTTNTRVEGSFTPSAINYIGIEFTRQVDDTTTSQVYFWNPTTENEFTKTVPLAETLDYKFVISSSVFGSNVLPLAIVETDAANNVLRVEDRRPMLFRLGTAGSATPDPTYVYPWNNHPEGREENFYSSTSSSSSPFRGGDKQLKSQKEWMDAIMSAIKEIKGTTYWYSENAGGSLVKARADLANLMMTGSGDISHSEGIAGRLNWSDDIFFNFVGSRLSYKLAANPASTHITLSDDQAAYIKLIRGVNITPNLILTNGSSVVTSVGAVSWTNDVLAGDFIKLASEDDTKYYKILTVDSASQVTLTEVYAETSTGAGGAQSQYAWGTYSTSASPSTDRHVKVVNRKDVPFDEDTYWLFLRQDNAGTLARVYVRGNGFGELEQGERRQISDNENLDILEYIGSPAEHVSTPAYENALITGVTEVTTLTFPPASSITSGQAWIQYSANDVNKHYFWFNKDGAGGDPLVPNAFGHAIVISTGDADTVVAAAAQAVIDALGDFDAVDNLDGTVTVTNAQIGSTTDASNIDVGGVFAINVDTQGAGVANSYIIEGEDLTKTAKRLDMAIAQVANSITEDGYEEIITIVSGAPVDDNEVTGPVLSGTNITIPLNSRISDIQQSYTVGAGLLAIYLNGVRLNVNADYTEVGLSGSDSVEIQTLVDLEIDDVLTFKIEAQGIGAGGGGGSSYTGVNLGSPSSANVFKQLAGSQFQFRRLTAGTNINITENPNDIVISSSAGVGTSAIATYTNSYSMTSTDDAALGDTSSNNITFTLPDASSVSGKIFYFKKISASNSMLIKSVSGQLLDGSDIDAAPYAITVIYESVTIISDGSNWWII